MAAFAKSTRSAFALSGNILRSSLSGRVVINPQIKRLYSIVFMKSTVSAVLNQRLIPGPSGQVRHFAEAKPSVEQIRERVLKVCKAFDKIASTKLCLDSHFMNDLGLDSLDHVEIIMAMEDEFGFEIPDRDAEKLLKPADIVRYVADREDIYE